MIFCRDQRPDRVSLAVPCQQVRPDEPPWTSWEIAVEDLLGIVCVSAPERLLLHGESGRRCSRLSSCRFRCSFLEYFLPQKHTKRCGWPLRLARDLLFGDALVGVLASVADCSMLAMARGAKVKQLLSYHKLCLGWPRQQNTSPARLNPGKQRREKQVLARLQERRRFRSYVPTRAGLVQGSSPKIWLVHMSRRTLAFSSAGNRFV